jgi:NADPH:quinone reductase-like Zn-dependent oxidoreductase
MGRRGRIFGTQLRARPLEQKAAAVQAFAREVVPHLSAGRNRAVIDNIFAVEEAAAAFEAMASRGKFGKILLAF